MSSLSQFTKSASFQAHFSHRGSEYTVDVCVPDLTDNHHQCWGDWGPMYTIKIAPEQRIQLVYQCRERSLLAKYSLKAKKVELNSPMFAKEREQHPLYLEIVDQARALRFLAFLSHDGSVDKVEVELVHPDYELDELLFPQAQVQNETQLSA